MQEPTQETGKQTEGCVYLRILLEWLRPLKSIINIGYLVMNNSVRNLELNIFTIHLLHSEIIPFR